METAPAADLPDVFENTSHLIIELHNAIAGARGAAIRIAYARLEHSLDGMNTAHIELDKLLGQSRLLSESLGRVIQFHVNRRKAQQS